MVPLMMEEGYRATGWLGLILGARLWYPFYDSAVETDAAFTHQMTMVAREIGERGKGGGRVASREPAPAPQAASPGASSPVPAPAPVPSPAPRTSSTAQSRVAPCSSPSMQLTAPARTHNADDSALVQVLLEHEHKLLMLMLEREEKLRHEMVSTTAHKRLLSLDCVFTHRCRRRRRRCCCRRRS